MPYYRSYSKNNIPEKLRSFLKYDGIMFEFVPSSDILLRNRKKTSGTLTLYDVSNRGDQKEISSFSHSFSSVEEVMDAFERWSKDESELVRFLSG